MTLDPNLISGFYGAVLGALLSSLITPLISEKLQKNRVIKEQKAQILKDLVATRFDSPQDQRAAEAINYIPLLFGRDLSVFRAYQQYRDADDIGSKEASPKFGELVTAIAKNIGVTGHQDLLRIPMMCKKRVMEDDKINEEWEEFKKKKGISNANA